MPGSSSSGSTPKLDVNISESLISFMQVSIVSSYTCWPSPSPPPSTLHIFLYWIKNQEQILFAVDCFLLFLCGRNTSQTLSSFLKKNINVVYGFFVFSQLLMIILQPTGRLDRFRLTIFFRDFYWCNMNGTSK